MMKYSDDLSEQFQSASEPHFQNSIDLGEIEIQYQYQEHQNNQERINSINSLSIKSNQIDKKKKNKYRAQTWRRKPGETKNIPKNFAGALKKYIQNMITNSQDETIRFFQKDKNWIKFKNVPHDEVMKNQIEQFIYTPMGQLFSKQFFGNCLWSSYFVQENKTNVAMYFQHNLTYFEKAFIKKQKVIKNRTQNKKIKIDINQLAKNDI